MTDTKRAVEESHESDGSSAPKLKKFKKPLNKPISEAGNQLTQNDVIYYQKEALFRVLNFERVKHGLLSDRFEKLDTDFSSLLNCFNVLNNWYDQLINNLTSLNGEGVGNSTEEKLFDKLLVKFDINGNEVIDSESLTTKRDKLIELIKSIISNSNSQVKLDENLLNLQENLTLSNVQIENYKVENSQLKDKLEDLNLELDNFIKAKDRSESQSLKRVEGIKKEEDSDIVKKEGSNGSSDVKGADSKDSTNQDSNVNNENSNGSSQILEKNQIIVNKFDYDDLNLKLQEYSTKNNLLKDEITKQHSLVNNLKSEILALTNRLSSLSEEDLVNLDSFKKIVNEKNQINELLNEANSNIDKLKANFEKFDKSFTTHEVTLNENFNKEMGLNNQHLLKIENDLVRIRTDRDELTSKVSILKSEKGKNELSEEYKKLNEFLETRISELEKKFDENYILESVQSLDESLDDKEKIELLLKYNSRLSTELKQVEEAFQKSRNLISGKLSKYLENDQIINKLNIEKNKADQKYFSAMRSKDALSSQNKILNLNIVKQNELIENLKETETKLIKKTELIENNFFEKLNNLEKFYNKDLSYQINKNKELESSLKALNTKFQELNQTNFKNLELFENKTKEFNNLEIEYNLIKNKLKNIENQLAKYRASSNNNNTSSMDAEEDEVKSGLLFMTKCQLCNKNFKDITLKTCGHCFCKDCINDRLNSRMRKCPNCNKQFSTYDLLEIHL